MSGSVNILTPNGRRQNVKYSANMTVLQIIENVCKKQGFVSEEYELRHQRKILDPKLSMRFSNIPNNAKLELVKADKLRTESSTHIALQLPDGERLQHTFSPSSSLWDIIEHWQQTLQRKLLADSEDGRPIEPNLVYLTHNISGESMLKGTKLRSIGLTGGKAVIRLSGRVVPSDEQFTTEESTENKSKKPKLETCSSESYMNKMDTVEGIEKPSHSTDFHQEEMGEPEEHSKAVSADTFTHFNVEQNHLGPEQQRDTDANIEISETEKTTSPEDDDRSKGSKVSGTPVKESLQKPGVDVRMETRIKTPVSEPQQNLGPDVRRKETKIKEAPVREPLQNPRLHGSPFTDFKFPESATDVESNSEMNVDESNELLPQVCDRGAVVFDLSGDNLQEISNDTPDEFFEVTVDDVRKRLADLKHQSSASDAPLQTNKMRENKEKQKMLRYKQIVIRIVFPDKTVLQGFFRPQETVQALFEFVQTSLEEKSLEFYLYISPPKTILKNTKETLFEANLFPAAKVYFGCKYKSSTWLSQSLLSSITPVAVANESLKSISVTGLIETSNKPSTSEGQSFERQQASTVAASKRPSCSATTNSQKIPKWFKLGKQ